MPSRRQPGQSLRRAIDAMCRACIHDPIAGAGHWRQQVDACTAANCPQEADPPRTRPLPLGGQRSRR